MSFESLFLGHIKESITKCVKLFTVNKHIRTEKSYKNILGTIHNGIQGPTKEKKVMEHISLRNNIGEIKLTKNVNAHCPD